MGKFKVHLKLQGLELDIEGDRSDMPAINNAVAREITGLIQPAAALTSSTEPSPPATIEGEIDNSKRLVARSRKRSGKTSSEGGTTQALDFRHEPEKYGNPQQTWSVLDKAIWMLAVIKGILAEKEVSGPQIAATYNDKFKQAGKLHPPNVTRDLGLAKVQNPPPVGRIRTSGISRMRAIEKRRSLSRTSPRQLHEHQALRRCLQHRQPAGS